LFGASIAAAYAVFRLGMGRVLSLAGALILSYSPLHLKYLTALRDYAKAPFMIALLFLIGLFVKQRSGWKAVLATAAAYGAVAGIGYGFRTDFLSFIPPFIICAFLFLEGGLRRHLMLKFAAAATCVGVFAIAAWPVFASLDRSRPGCQWHVVMTGLARQFDEPLGIEPAPYEVNREYLDEYAHTTVTSYAGRRHPGIGRLDYCEAGHGAATREYLIDVVTRFPADVVIRAYASLLRIVDLPWIGPEIADESKDVPDFSVGHYRGVPIVLAAAIVLTAVDPRLGLCFAFVLLYFGGLPGLQFDPRHFFHLEIVTWWCIGFLVHTATAVARRRQFREQVVFALRPAARATVLVGLCVVALTALLWAARAYQQAATRTLLNAYVAAPRDRIAADAALGSDSGSALRVSPRTQPETADYIAVDLNAARCSNATAVVFTYDDPRRAYGRTFRVGRDAADGLTQIYMPIYDGFKRLDLVDASPECVDGIYRMREPRRFGLLLETILRPGWRRAPLYQQLKSRS